MQKQFKYIYNNEEVSREDFEKLAGDIFKWFDGDSIVSVPFSSFDSFFTGDFKSSEQINDHLSSILESKVKSKKFKNLEQDIVKNTEVCDKYFMNHIYKNPQEKNTNSTRHKSQAGETHLYKVLEHLNNNAKTQHLAVVGNLEGINRPPSKEKIIDNINSVLNNWMVRNPTDGLEMGQIKDDVITSSNRGEKETMEYLQGVKHNQLKPRLDIVINTQFPKALQLLSLATEYGNYKYFETDKDMLNFKRVEGGSQTYFNASARHSTDRDGLDESGLPHIIHAVWSSLAGLELWAEENRINVKEFTENYMKNLQD